MFKKIEKDPKDEIGSIQGTDGENDPHSGSFEAQGAPPLKAVGGKTGSPVFIQNQSLPVHHEAEIIPAGRRSNLQGCHRPERSALFSEIRRPEHFLRMPFVDDPADPSVVKVCVINISLRINFYKEKYLVREFVGIVDSLDSFL